jgi:hypothetical protein
MVAGGATYGVYEFTSCSSHERSCAVATSGGCCATDAVSCPGDSAKEHEATSLTSALSSDAALHVSAAVAPVEIEGCCEACCSPSRHVTRAAKAVVEFK